MDAVRAEVAEVRKADPPREFFKPLHTFVDKHRHHRPKAG